jgi:hypothetical protein
MKILKPEDMPAPDALIQHPDGSIQPAMFYYAGESTDCVDIAREYGFDCAFISLEQNDPELAEEYGDRQLTLTDIPNWRPIAPEGFTFAGCWDTEDGPICFYLKPLKKDEAA